MLTFKRTRDTISMVTTEWLLEPNFVNERMKSVTENKEKVLPGIDAYIESDEKGFSKIQMLLEATGGLSLSQVCAVTGLEGSTIQNWVKRGWVEHPNGKRYEEVHIARILIINALKECIKLEHISLLMSYVTKAENGEATIKESELFNYLCEALALMGRVSGVEAAVDSVLLGYDGPTSNCKARLVKALSLMMYACVCTDVKRRTESMMQQVLHDLENPKKVEDKPESQDVQETTETEVENEVQEDEETPETRKTIAQTLREWDVSSVERAVIDEKNENQPKPVIRPWFSRKNPK